MAVYDPFRYSGCAAWKAQPDRWFNIESSINVSIPNFMINFSFQEKVIIENTVVNAFTDDDNLDSQVSNGGLKSCRSLAIR